MPGNVVEQPAGPDVLVVEAECPDATPASVFTYWIQPELLTLWWPRVAELDVRVRGAYHLAWPPNDWHLRGRYTAVEPGEQLAFTWCWDGDVEADETDVNARFAPLPGGGTRLTLTHGPYDESEAASVMRRGHLDGWRHFLLRLGEALESARS
ncbi:MAG TPA: SRPBCC domain-containing protein [Ktedonobacterales bacterium]|nr:SRPBCC domain-containing protein [Ktedonobacterales bacterium]